MRVAFSGIGKYAAEIFSDESRFSRNARLVQVVCPVESHITGQYALSYNSCWYMFGNRPGEDELLVYSLQNSAEIRKLDKTADPPEDFRLGEITIKPWHRVEVTLTR